MTLARWHWPEHLAALARLSPVSRRPCATFVLAECHRLLPHRQRQQERLVRLLWPLSRLPHPLVRLWARQWPRQCLQPQQPRQLP